MSALTPPIDALTGHDIACLRRSSRRLGSFEATESRYPADRHAPDVRCDVEAPDAVPARTDE